MEKLENYKSMLEFYLDSIKVFKKKAEEKIEECRKNEIEESRFFYEGKNSAYNTSLSMLEVLYKVFTEVILNNEK